jgi:iduronate 2-sulfatase
MMRINHCALLVISIVFCLDARAQTSSAKRNVLYLVSDDLCTDLGCYGAPVKSPNVDRLAARGVRFDRAYCQFPLCGPSRCSFLAGLRPNTTDVVANGLPVRHKLKDVVTLPQLFRQNGYFVARVGKMYHLNIPNDVGKPGPDDPESWDTTFNPKGNEFPSDDDGEKFDPDPKNGQSFRRNLLNGDGRDQADYQIADEAIRLLREHKDKPFFLAVGFIRPHVPEVAPRSFFELYPPDSIALPQDSPDLRKQIPTLAFTNQKWNWGMNESDVRESIRAYHATTSFMDAQLGRVVDELDRLGLADNTVILFQSDHGYSLGQHGAWQKMMLFERVCRVPLIIIEPGTRHAGATARGLTELVDIYPTIAELCGLKGPAALEGRSAVSVLEHPDQPFQDAAFAQVTRARNAGGRTVRTDRWRYTEWDEGRGGAELYDETNDPNEWKNLANDDAQRATIAELREKLHKQFPTTRPAEKK